MRPSLERKVLLVLDGHKTHTHNIPALQRASASGVIMLSLPPHTSHKTQPLDLSFFKPLKTYYSQNIDQWMRAHPGRAVTMYQVSQLFGSAYAKAASVSTAINGFRKSGLFPVNPDVYHESEFLPADITEIPHPEIQDSSMVSEDSNAEDTNNRPTVNANSAFQNFSNPSDGIPSNLLDTASANSLNDVLNKPLDSNPFPSNKNQEVQINPPSDIPGCSRQKEVVGSGQCNDYSNNDCNRPCYVSVEDISPLPKRSLTSQVGSKRRPASRSTILTSSPHKRAVMAISKKAKPQQFKKINQHKKKQGVKTSSKKEF